MQFSSPYNEVYSHVIKDACVDFNIDAVRGDETNPNVYFEVGYALALGKPIILLAQRRTPETPLPFDLSAFRVLFYDDSIGGKPKLETGLRNHLTEILGRD
jgi:nucleoside 2-deoxyribosyltransferase